MALQVYNEVHLRTSPGAGLTIRVSGTAAPEDLPLNESNLVYRVIARVLELTGTRAGSMELDLTVNAPLARGVGSSASAIVAGMVAANAISSAPLSEQALLREMVAVEGHPDNIVPCFFGGLTACFCHDHGLVYERYEPHPSVRCVLLIPDYELRTVKARQALPKSVPIRDAVFNLSRVPFVIRGLTSGNLEDLSAAMDDRLHQPYRKRLIREYDSIAAEAQKAGAAAVCLSGAGPTMLALTTEPFTRAVAAAMEGVLTAIGTRSKAFITAPALKGAQVLS
jgi:homoserine kinase